MASRTDDEMLGCIRNPDWSREKQNNYSHWWIGKQVCAGERELSRRDRSRHLAGLARPARRARRQHCAAITVGWLTSALLDACVEDSMADDSDRGIDPQPAGVTLGEADVQRAQALSAKAHQGQVDKAGLPYIDHPRRVVGYLVNPTAQEVIVAWLHDVVEGTALTLEYVQKEFGSQVAAAVDAITRRPDETRSDYYARVKANPMALTVKAADLDDNTDPERLQLLEPDVRADLEARYAHARHELGIE